MEGENLRPNLEVIRVSHLGTEEQQGVEEAGHEQAGEGWVIEDLGVWGLDEPDVLSLAKSRFLVVVDGLKFFVMFLRLRFEVYVHRNILSLLAGRVWLGTFLNLNVWFIAFFTSFTALIFFISELLLLSVLFFKELFFFPEESVTFPAR